MNTFKSILFFLVLISLSRLIPHPPHFTPLIAAVIFLPYILEDKRGILMIPLAVLLITDYILGFYQQMLWVYGSIILLSSLSLIFHKKSFIRLLTLSFFAPSIFFIITNFGVWYGSSIYSQNTTGFFQCYFNAIPFYANHLISTVLFSLVFYVCFRFIKGRNQISSDASY